ncbi:hypothetical protein TrVE_jg11419 [Triparma verrucosa]|uniref:Actin-related protein 2/3 complex subunit 3 n=2 Tax=Triparma TaxID=722752 RepID=A0A9W7DW24_9STRA|nr:hypothetical protein TrST_g4143 [Triparma strigata]GMI08954.1 hypothetical protein TrVE_jg11419 [Triparma verrucosa]|mmetsp:Transcript_17701/g.33000  ORF Transcript_17701/g.33000 Transcript_17701/m.33000 type:complete len:176 (+) Transcript_17701:23-550(+)
MPAYHSKVDFESFPTACGCSILPLKTQTRGPAPPHEGDGADIIDETISFFRANVLFKNFDVAGGADRTLIYLTLYLQSCMVACEKVADKKEAKTVLYQHAIKPFVCPGDPGWGLGGMFPNAANREESDSFKAYFKQARTELSERLLDVIYGADGAHNKWWMCFVKRKFMGKELRN